MDVQMVSGQFRNGGLSFLIAPIRHQLYSVHSSVLSHLHSSEFLVNSTRKHDEGVWMLTSDAGTILVSVQHSPFVSRRGPYCYHIVIRRVPEFCDNTLLLSRPPLPKQKRLASGETLCSMSAGEASSSSFGKSFKNFSPHNLGSSIWRFLSGVSSNGSNSKFERQKGDDKRFGKRAKRQLHVAWLGKKSPFCGNVTYGKEITNALKERGYQISMFHFSQSEETIAQHFTRFRRSGSTSNQYPSDLKSSAMVTKVNNLGFYEVSLPCLYKSQIYTIPTPKSNQVFIDSLRNIKPDVIHASLTLSPLDFTLPEIADELNMPLVATFHPPFSSKRKSLTSNAQFMVYKLYAPFLAHYDRIVIFSDVQRDLLMRLGVPRGRIAVIPNGVDPDRYCPARSNLKREIKADTVFVYMGRIAPEKNVEALLEAWVQAKMGPRCKLVIVGNGPLAAGLQQTYRADQGVVWKGFVEGLDARLEILRGADVFVLPSFVEGLSLSLLEAMSVGLACVATDAGADGEVLSDGAGIPIDTENVVGQLRTLLPVLRDQPELRKVLGQKARQRVLEKYTLKDNIDRLETLYADVIEERRRRTPVKRRGKTSLVLQ
eukprot:CAMPEP_0196656214 /NCGR_PEP_ID=MMETSP1086-20130531/13987_1 /TAXON_ID=77921 /ORGANISM="Cyanoptyche  gloeocystis , Strain SAG4.97" /LENGTH=598 /DNA_ID=CAMNT_0041988863 /DNA_START=189 /DNA_END=1985 /DNA_ORIENTATION=-